MKKLTSFAIGLTLCLGLVSWGYEGHYAIADIASHHLTPNAQAAVKNLLGHKSMADVSSYADDLRTDPAYSGTSALHFLNIPMGYTYQQFSDYVKSRPTQTIYTGIIGCINELRDPKSSKSKKEFSLELLIHFVGDCHQPMHVSRLEDKGGNSTNVTFLGGGTNLHSLWDSGLLQHQKINYKDLAAKYDDATPAQIKQWQSDDIMKWLWESYQITNILYREAADNPNFDEKYYQDHIPVIKSRIEKAGIRLAGVLNEIYK